MLPTKKPLMEELEKMRRAIDRIWDRYAGEFFPRTSELQWVPPVDVMDTEDSVVVTIEIPGLRPENIDISVTADRLNISGDKQKEGVEKEQDYHFAELRYGKFSRSIQLPATVDPDRVEAYYRNGILRITMVKAEKAKTKHIKIKAA